MKGVVVGNPCNTNCLIALSRFNRLPKTALTAMTRLDQNRAYGQIALKANCRVGDIHQLPIFGNHSPTMYPYLERATINGKPLREVINDDEYLKNAFLKTIQLRGAEIIE